MKITKSDYVGVSIAQTNICMLPKSVRKYRLTVVYPDERSY